MKKFIFGLQHAVAEIWFIILFGTIILFGYRSCDTVASQSTSSFVSIAAADIENGANLLRVGEQAELLVIQRVQGAEGELSVRELFSTDDPVTINALLDANGQHITQLNVAPATYLIELPPEERGALVTALAFEKKVVFLLPSSEPTPMDLPTLDFDSEDNELHLTIPASYIPPDMRSFELSSKVVILLEQAGDEPLQYDARVVGSREKQGSLLDVTYAVERGAGDARLLALTASLPTIKVVRVLPPLANQPPIRPNANGKFVLLEIPRSTTIITTTQVSVGATVTMIADGNTFEPFRFDAQLISKDASTFLFWFEGDIEADYQSKIDTIYVLSEAGTVDTDESETTQTVTEAETED